jgi:hypothetical protein
MNEQQFSAITIKALMRHYQVELEPDGDGSYFGKIPICRLPTVRLQLSADGASWSVKNRFIPECGDRPEFIMYMEQVSRETASHMLYNVYPTLLKRENIPEEG